VGDIRTKVASGPGAASTDQLGEALREGDIESLGQPFHDGAERLEEYDLRLIAHG
jgi:hypothetical protein